MGIKFVGIRQRRLFEMHGHLGAFQGTFSVGTQLGACDVHPSSSDPTEMVESLLTV